MNTLGKFEFFGLCCSSDMAIVDSEWNTSFMSKDIFQILLGFLKVHPTEYSSNFKSVFVVHTNITALSFGSFFCDLGLSTISFNHCYFLKKKIYKIYTLK